MESTTSKPLNFTIEYSDNLAVFAYEASNVQPFETILETFDYKDIRGIEWKSKYNKYVKYDFEPFCCDDFIKCRRLKFKSKEHIKFFLYLLNDHIDNIKQLQMDYNTNNNSNIIKEVNDYNGNR